MKLVEFLFKGPDPSSRSTNPHDLQVHSNFLRRLYRIPASGRVAGGCHSDWRPERLTPSSARPVKQPK